MVWETYFVWVILLNLSGYILWPRMWSIMVNIACKLEKKVCSSVGWSLLHMSVRLHWWTVPFRSTLDLVISCLLDLAVIDGVGSRAKVSNYSNWLLIVSFQFHHLLPPGFWWFYCWVHICLFSCCVHTRLGCYVFLDDPFIIM